MKNETILAVDFGTSNSLAGAWHEGQRVEALSLDSGAPDPSLLRTILYFPHKDACYYGHQAITQFIEHDLEGRLFRSFKSHLPNRSYLGTFINDRVLSLENLIGIFLLEIKKRSEALLQTEVTAVVLGRPARYSLDPASESFALHRMTKAAEFAGFKKIHFVPEPLAAAFDYRRQLKSEKLVLIGDFGGGTSDFTLIRIGPYTYEKNHVLGLDGCALAGDALDSLLMSHRLNEFLGAQVKYKMFLGRNEMTMPRSIVDRLNQPAHIVHLKEPATYEFIKEVRKGALQQKDREAIDRLFLMLEDQQIFSFYEAIERTKRLLSDQITASFRFDYPGLEVEAQFTRKEFEDWAHPLQTKIFSALDECLNQAQIKSEQIDLVCLTGGSAKVPMIHHEFVRRFGVEKLQTQSHFHSVLSGLVESAGFVAEGLM